MNRYFVSPESLRGFRNGSGARHCIYRLGEVAYFGDSPICQDLLIMNGARSGQCLKNFDAQIYVNY